MFDNGSQTIILKFFYSFFSRFVSKTYQPNQPKQQQNE